MREDSTVVYADILGFSTLVMSGRGDNLDGSYYSNSSEEDLREWIGRDSPDKLTRIFTVFHRMLELHIQDIGQTDFIQIVVFSDSAFVAFRDVNTALLFAQKFMRALISFEVPVRMGVGCGTFRGLRLTTDVSDGFRRHTSQFLGTGVVRAHAAEACGLKGLRIFVHPDSQIPEDLQAELCEVAGEGNRSHVVQELNYVEHLPDFAPRDGIGNTREAFDELVGRVNRMMEASTEETVRTQYRQTLIALERMRAAYQREDSPFFG